MTESYVDQALTIWNRMLTCPELTSLLLKMDKAYGHDAPLNGVVQYQLLISKTRTQARSYYNIESFFGVLVGDVAMVLAMH